MGTNAESMAPVEGLEKKRKMEEEWSSIYASKQPLNRSHFPPNFIFGVATSAFQVEGAWNEDGRGPSIWDAFSRIPGNIHDGSNADVSVDQYHRYKEDIELIAKLGFKAYRFSISWSRIFPDGLGSKVNLEGIRHYNDVINALIDNDIQPYVTLYHWDLPLNLLEAMGGWLNEQIVKYFAIYAETCFSSFGDRVKNWITINEPLQTAVNGYCTGIYAPGRSEHPSKEPYLVAHHQLLAHAEAVSIYYKKYKDKQGGQIGLAVDCEWSEAYSDGVEDVNAASRRLDFQLGWFLDPIYFGDYPQSMRKKLGDCLPKFSERDKELLKYSVDFVGLNLYTTRFVRKATNGLEESDFYRVQEAERIAEWKGGETIGEKAASSWLYMVPWGLWKLLKYISMRYNNPAVYITENGKASRLLVTSRNQIISEHHGYVHRMKLLNSDESQELLLKTAFIGTSEGRFPQELEEIGREILKKCHGLPLAITVAGGLLVHHGESMSGWDRVLKQIRNYHSETSEIGTSVSEILELSYHNLPSHLKPCFLCLAFFKEGEVIRVIRLVHIWVALGLIQAGEESAEEMAMSYLDELINRNLVQVEDMAVDDRVKYCHVHDLLRELSIRKAKEEIGFESLIYNEEEVSSSSSSSYKPRHRVVRGIRERLIMIDSSNQKKCLRSLFSHVEVPDKSYFTSPSYWESFELLRILDIEGSKLDKFPPKLRALIGLRYLRLREALGYLRLPSWLDVLKNLEVLDIAECKLVTFPDVTWKMDSLRHFYTSGRCDGFSDSMKKSSWPSLETLKYVKSDNLLCDNQGQGFSRRLCKLGVELVSGKKGEIEMGNLLVESAVKVLHLRCPFWRECGTLPIPNSLDHLTKLKLQGPILLLPTADKFPKNITHLTLSRSCINAKDVMQELGKLPNLLVLKLDDAFSHQLIKVPREGFLRLKLLHLRELSLLSYIEIEEGGMPKLQRLELDHCPYLKNIENLKERIRPAEFFIIAH